MASCIDTDVGTDKAVITNGTNSGDIDVTSLAVGTGTLTITVPQTANYKQATKTISVEVTSGYMSGDVTITGENTYLKTLTVNTSDIKPAGSTLTYQWYYGSNADGSGKHLS